MPGLRHEFYISSLFFKPPCKITGYHPFFPTNHTQSINPTPPPRHQCPCLCPRRPPFVANFCWHSNFTQPQFSLKQMAPFTHCSAWSSLFFLFFLFFFLFFSPLPPHATPQNLLLPCPTNNPTIPKLPPPPLPPPLRPKRTRLKPFWILVPT